MSSKFFTWTKGDRNIATTEALRSGRIVPIPVECIRIQGLDFARTEKGSSKANNRPLPLVIDGSPTPSSKRSSRTNNSIALHEAAVKSATTLMTIMNDMLHSPQLSAHIQPSRDHFGKATDGPHRPRAYTAPSTPLVEIAPSMDPVELPGSFPDDGNSYLQPNRHDAFGRHYPRQNVGEKIVRSRSSPQEASCPLIPRRGRMSVHSYYRDAASIYRSLQDHQLRAADDSLPSYDANEVLPSEHGTALTQSTKQLPLHIPKTSMLASPIDSVHDLLPRVVLDKSDTANTSDAAIDVASDPATNLLEQIPKMRACHEAYIRSLKEAHEREMESQKSYICFLETRRKIHASGQIEVSRAISEEGSDIVDGTLSFDHKTHSDMAANDGHMNELRRGLEIKDEEIKRLNGIVQKAKASEKALQNALGNLEGRLVIANNERTDVLEGFNEASAKLQTLAKREQVLDQELRDLQRRFLTSNSARLPPLSPSLPKPLRIKHKRTVSDVGASASTWPPFSRPFQDVPEIGSGPRQGEKRNTIMASSNLDCSKTPCYPRVTELEREIERLKVSLDSALADAERYNSLLHSELRRQNRHIVEKSLPSIPSVDAEASAISETRISQLKGRLECTESSEVLQPTTTGESSTRNDLVASLEKELQQCVREIILYKLDVRGYKKDLKKANAKIEHLEAMTTSLRPSTPERESPLSMRTTLNSARPQSRHVSETITQTVAATGPPEPGLGISLQEASASTAASDLHHTRRSRVAATPPPPFSTPLSPPTTRPKTPLGTHKKLPKPPHFAMPGCSSPPMTPPLQAKVQRAQTFRSFSESMVPSCGKDGLG